MKPTVAFGAALLLTSWLVPSSTARAQAPTDPDSVTSEQVTSEQERADAEAAPEPAPPPAGVETPLTLADEGVKAYRAGDYEAAQPKLEAAYRELPLPTIGLWLARNLDRLARLLEARDRYQAIVDESPAATEATLSQARARGLAPPGAKEQKDAKEDAALELELLVARIPTLVVAVDGAPLGETQVTLDDGPAPTDAPRSLDPGRYRISGTWQDQTVTRAIVLHERDRATVGLPFRTEPLEEPSGTGHHLVGWVLIGTGAAAAAGGAVIGAIAWSKHADLDCPDNQCQPSQRADVDAYNDLRLPSGFLIFGGGVLAATGVAVILNAPQDHEQEAAVSAQIGPGFVGLRGRF